MFITVYRKSDNIIDGVTISFMYSFNMISCLSYIDVSCQFFNNFVDYTIFSYTITFIINKFMYFIYIETINYINSNYVNI